MSDFQPNRFVALGLSFISPGVGQIYKSEVVKGLSIVFSRYLLAALGIFFSLFDYFWYMGFYILSLILIWLYALLDASEVKDHPIKATQYNRWYSCLIIAFLVIGTNYGVQKLSNTYYQGYKIKGVSHEPTLFARDHVLVNHKFYKDKPIERFDLVVFNQLDNPTTAIDESQKKNTFIRRVVGLPGDQIEINDAKIFLNGAPMKDDYGIWGGEDKGHYGPYSIPENSYFMLGDNRDPSRDSRHYHNPFIPAKNILGKLAYVYFNINNPERIGTYLK